MVTKKWLAVADLHEFTNTIATKVVEKGFHSDDILILLFTRHLRNR